MNYKIILCDYSGITKGHTLKVLKEYSELLKDINIKPIICAPKSYEKFFSDYMFICLPFSISQNNSDKKLIRLFQLIINQIKLLLNFRKILSLHGTIWITNVGINFFVYLFFAFKKKCKIIVTLYSQSYTSSFKNISALNLIYKSSLKKIDYIVSTNNSLKFNNKTIYLKDYYFSELYKNFSVPYSKKKKQLVCLGTVDNKKKDILGLILAMKKIDIPLIIVGYFHDKNYYQRAVELNKNNKIKIINKNILDDEYYKLLSESMFALLPYRKDAYHKKTSGVLQECIFLNTIPITHKEILSFNNIPGIGYNNINELNKLDFCSVNYNEYYNNYAQLINSVYNKNIFLEKIKKMLINLHVI